MVDGLGLADEDLALVEDPAQRDDDMARGDGSGGRLGQEGLIGHVRVGRDHQDLDLAARQLLFQLPLQAQRRVHPDVAAADNQNARGAGGRPELSAFTSP